MILVIGGMAQGKHEFARERFPGKRIIDLDIELDIQDQIKDDPDCVVVTTEVGCGIVPIERKDRDLREQVGRAQVAAAKSAEEVYRVIAGIGQKIK